MTVFGHGDVDFIEADPVIGARIALTLDGHGRRERPELRGSAGTDLLVGSPGDDVVGGGIGADVAIMGGGLDTFTWGPGEGSDVVEGGAGDDFLRMTGSGAGERFDVTALGVRTRVTRDVENVALVSRLDNLHGTGADTVHVGDLSGTGTTNVELNLARARATIERDREADAVLVDGTAGTDAITANGLGAFVRLTGLAAVVSTVFSEPALDRLHVDTKAGLETVAVTGSTHQLIAFGFTQ